jgi:hypothetical protein
MSNNKKYLRLGYTETSLLFFYWYQLNISKNNQKINSEKKIFIKWLYTTSGYYDNQIISNYMDAEHNNDDPYIYINYMNKLLNFIQNSDNFTFGIHYDKNTEEFKNFLTFLNIKNNNYMGKNFIFDLIKNQKVLFISPFANLFKQQIESENLNKIYPEFIKPLNSYYYINIYTFNKGPHNNILETVDFLFNDINDKIENNYDIVIISAGAYSIILAEKFYNNQKTVCTIGGELQPIFGIMNNRSRKNNNVINQEFWIMNVPDEYKPKNYEKIENGCYW